MKEKIMKAFKIKQDLYWTGVLDPELRVFDIIMETKYGTSYNSYLLEGSEKTALFETAKLAFLMRWSGTSSLWLLFPRSTI